MYKALSHFYERLIAILATAWGWAVASALAIMDYFAGHVFVLFLVVAVTVMDAVWGIILSHRLGYFTLSELARQTVAKLAVYGCALFVFVGLDKFADTTVGASVVGAVITLVEFWSSCAIMLCLFPYIPVLKLLKKALTGEIASKLHIPEDEVDSVLNEGVGSLAAHKHKLYDDKRDS